MVPLSQSSESPDILKAIFGVIGALVSSGLLAYCFGWFRRAIDARNRTRLMMGLENIKRGRDVLAAIADLPYVTRVMQFNGHDSGAAPNIGRPFYATMVDRHPRTGNGVELENYDHVKVDDGYINMLLAMIRDGVYSFVTETEPDCLLKSIYSAQGVVHSKLFYVGAYQDRLLYLSVSSHEAVFTDAQRVEITILVDKFRACFRSRQ